MRYISNRPIDLFTDSARCITLLHRATRGEFLSLRLTKEGVKKDIKNKISLYVERSRCKRHVSDENVNLIKCMMQNEFSAAEMPRTVLHGGVDGTRSSVKSNCDAVFSTWSTRDECQCTRRALFATKVECERTGIERALRHRTRHFRYI